MYSKKYNEYYNKESLVISINHQGTFLNYSIPIIKISYTILKSDFKKVPPSVSTIEKILNKQNRVKWDKLIKRTKILHQDKNNTFIQHTWFKKFEFNINERDVIEKKISFYKDSNYYSFGSSIGEEQYKKIPNVERIISYISGLKICEDNNKITIKILLQLDYKIGSLFNFLNKTLPRKMDEWFRCLIEEINK